MNRKIIAFHGPAGAGKDTAAFAIKESTSNTEILSFAGPLKDACKILFNFSNDQVYHPVIKEEIDERWKKSPRQILQWLGTDILRTHINQDFLIMNMKQRMDSSNADYIIISDVRFDNEAEFIRSLGGKIVKIERPNIKTTIHSDHASEKGISPDLIDAIVENNTSIEEFQTRIKLVSRVIFNTRNDHSNHFTGE